jgi:hypothetical protein
MYTFTFRLTVKEKVYYLDIPASFPGGKVTSNTENPYLASEGQTVTLTITPEEGYELESIYVYHYYGSTILIPLTGTGLTRSFVMPANHITVIAVFKLTKTNMEEVANAAGLKAYVENSVLYVSGLAAGTTWRVYNVLGTLIYQGVATDNETPLRLPNRGIYIVTDGKNVVKVTN